MPPNHPKGKGKAIERTPLLNSASTGDTPADNQPPRLPQPVWPPMRQAWRSYLLTAALTLLTLFLATLLGMVLLTESYAAPALLNMRRAWSLRGPDADEFWKQALLLYGPDDVNVVSVDRRKDELGVVHMEMNMSVTMRIAVDTDFIMGFREPDALDDGWWRKKWKQLGRWGVRQLGDTTAVVDHIDICPSPPTSLVPLVTLRPLQPIPIPLGPGLSSRDHDNPPASLTPVSVALLISPSHNASLLISFLKESWAQGFFSVRIHATKLLVYGGHEHNKPPKWWELRGWRNRLKIEKDRVMIDIKLTVPPLRFPSHSPSIPGSDLPALSDLLVLESFNITSSPSPPNSPQPFPTFLAQELYSIYLSTNPDTFRDQSSPAPHLGDVHSSSGSSYSPSAWTVLISARASLAHPFSNFTPQLDGVRPLPFVVSLPVKSDGNHASVASAGQKRGDLIPVAHVYASPTFNVTHLNIPLSGFVLPLSNSSPQLPDSISALVSSYLSYKPSPIAISSPFYPSLVIPALFPPPTEKLELLRDVAIENMRIYPGVGSRFLPNFDGETGSLFVDFASRGLGILASAMVHARVVLPRGMNIDIRVLRIWIDCLVFDGMVPSTIPVNSGPSFGTPEAQTSTPGENPRDPSVPEPLPLPIPLPDHAFARITPRNWLNASSTSVGNGADHVENVDTGTSVYVTAELVDVPLEVLPGRQSDLSNFVSKVQCMFFVHSDPSDILRVQILFSKNPVVAGIRGIAAVGVGVPGLTSPESSAPRVEGGELILTGLPFETNVRVGGRTF